MPAAIRIDAILLDSTRPEELASFYGRAFDLGEPRPHGPDHLGFALENTYLGFDRVASPRSGDSSPATVWFKVDSVEGSFRCLLDLGATAVHPPDRDESPGEIIAVVRDPEGNRLGLISPDPR